VSGFEVVALAEDVPPGTGRAVEVEGRAVALFNVGGTFYAIDGTCLHRGGPVGEGDLEDEIVTCPWHGWQYDVTTGRNVMDPDIGLAQYEVEIENGVVKVALND
jgi:nitrite reductase (NADH) small subunit/3-phenylpropionate/trans-cinnamate dioxygenase ferredoxin subunit